MLEVALTRVLSVMSWHHFAYLIISLAFLGFGAASTFLSVSPRFSSPTLDEGLVGKYALAFCLTTLFGFAATTKVHFYPMDAYYYGDYSNAFSLLMLYVIMGTPFFFAGVCIGYLISRAGEAINRVYFSDLVGAGIGTMASLVGINHLGVEATIYVASTAGGLVALIFSLAEGRFRLRLGSAAALVLSVLMTVLAVRHEIFPTYFPPEKIFREALRPHYYRWHIIARIDVMDPVSLSMPFGGALSKAYEGGPMPTVRVIWQDGSAPTGIMYVPNGDLRRVPALGYYLQAAPYAVKPNPSRALTIGLGGGIDALIALYHGAEHVVGVDVNPVTVDAVKNRYADFAGRVLNRPNVELVVAEGRHFLTTTDQRFDVIQLSGVDTYSALSTGAYALAENYLYTVEAMESYWEHLADGGILSFSRWLFTPPRETLRLVVIQLEHLRRMGIEHPESHLMIVSGGMPDGVWAETLLKKSPFTQAEVAAFRRWADYMKFDMIYDPYEMRPNVFNEVIRASRSEREAIIKRYPYNIKPVTDDNPFFFQFYRWRSLVSPLESGGGYFIERLPLSLAVLLVSLVQILLLSIAFIIGPLLPRGGQLRAVRHKTRVLTYFGSLGLGFIIVEITLLQKYAVFVGGPIYSMAITLFAILVFSGLGSLMSQRFKDSPDRWLKFIIIGLVGAVACEVVFINYTIPRLMFLSHAMRCGVTIAALAPLALLMGMPFPMGLRVTQRVGETIIPWAWGVNAVTTTLGSVLCVLVSMQWGFTVSLVAAGAVYLLGLAVFSPVVRAMYKEA